VTGEVLGLEELVDAVVTALAAQPGGLGASEGRDRVRHDPAVDSHHAELEPLGHREGTGQIPGEDIGGEPVVGVVGELQRLGTTLHGVQRRHRGEQLFGAQVAVPVVSASVHLCGLVATALSLSWSLRRPCLQTRRDSVAWCRPRLPRSVDRQVISVSIMPVAVLPWGTARDRNDPGGARFQVVERSFAGARRVHPTLNYRHQVSAPNARERWRMRLQPRLGLSVSFTEEAEESGLVWSGSSSRTLLRLVG
jgi:hypothetical protein